MGSGIRTSDPVDYIKDVLRSSVPATEFDKHLKKAGGHMGRNVVNLTKKMKTIVRKHWTIKKNGYSYSISFHLISHFLFGWLIFSRKCTNQLIPFAKSLLLIKLCKTISHKLFDIERSGCFWKCNFMSNPELEQETNTRPIFYICHHHQVTLT